MKSNPRVENARKLLEEARASKWEYAEIHQRFEEVPTAQYGDSMPKWVPDYAYTDRLMLDAVSQSLPVNGHGRVLDLGAGTGRFSRRLLETFDGCHVTLADFSQNMLDEVPNKLEGYFGRYETHQADFFANTLSFDDASFDCIVSVFAVCHGQSLEAYIHLYQNIARWLKPGGSFICYDHVLGATDTFTALNISGWHALIEPVLPPEAVHEAIVSTYQEDNPLPLHQHLELLAQVGFSATDVLYKRDIFAIYAGVKAAG